FETGGEVRHGRGGVGKQFFSRLGQPHAAGRARDQRHPDPRLERADRLADGGWRNAQIERGGAEAAPLGHPQEGDDAIEAAYAHVLNPLSNRDEHSRSRPLRVRATPIISHALMLPIPLDARKMHMSGTMMTPSRTALLAALIVSLAAGAAQAQENSP